MSNDREVHAPEALIYDDPRARVGSLLRGKWKLEALIGVGGSAAVYSASHRNNGMRAAVKVLHTELGRRPDLVARFINEGYFANKIGHRCAVPVLDDDRAEDGAVYMVMELLEGDSLENWVTGPDRLSFDDAIRVADEVLDLLAAAHAAGVIHRDIKPGNVFLTRGGGVKVLDFGIARLTEAPANPMSTQLGTQIGTPTFMPPEQARGRWNLVDGRSDVFGVGATLFALLTGKKPREAETANEELLLAMTTPMRPVAELRPEIPLALAHVVDRALAFEMSARWPDARAMQAAIRAARGALDEPSPATVINPPASTTRMPAKPSRPTPIPAVPPSSQTDITEAPTALKTAVFTQISPPPESAPHTPLPSTPFGEPPPPLFRAPTPPPSSPFVEAATAVAFVPQMRAASPPPMRASSPPPMRGASPPLPAPPTRGSSPSYVPPPPPTRASAMSPIPPPPPERASVAPPAAHPPTRPSAMSPVPPPPPERASVAPAAPPAPNGRAALERTAVSPQAPAPAASPPAAAASPPPGGLPSPSAMRAGRPMAPPPFVRASQPALPAAAPAPVSRGDMSPVPPPPPRARDENAGPAPVLGRGSPSSPPLPLPRGGPSSPVPGPPIASGSPSPVPRRPIALEKVRASAPSGPPFTGMTSTLTTTYDSQFGALVIGVYAPADQPPRLRCYALQAQSIAWQALKGDPRLMEACDVMILGREVFVAHRADLEVFDLVTGAPRWSVRLPDKIDTPLDGTFLMEAGGGSLPPLLLARTTSGAAVSLDRATGQERARRNLGAGLELSVVEGGQAAVLRYRVGDRYLLDVVNPVTLEPIGSMGKSLFGDSSTFLEARVEGTFVVARVEQWGILAAKGLLVLDGVHQREALFLRESNIDPDVAPTFGRGAACWATTGRSPQIQVAPGGRKAPPPIAGHRVVALKHLGAAILVALEDTARPGTVRLVGCDPLTLAPRFQGVTLAPTGSSRNTRREPARYALTNGHIAFVAVTREDGAGHELRAIDTSTGGVLWGLSLHDVGPIDHWHMAGPALVLKSQSVIQVVDPSRGAPVARYVSG